MHSIPECHHYDHNFTILLVYETRSRTYVLPFTWRTGLILCKSAFSDPIWIPCMLALQAMQGRNCLEFLLMQVIIKQDYKFLFLYKKIVMSINL